jgi:prepilin-type N-terminal cleavage/methylation domain-containing protein
MRGLTRQRTNRKSQAGFSLLELLAASIILTVGMLSITGIFALAIGNNGRSKVDTTATMLTQSVMEQVAAVRAGGGPSKVWDCNGTPHTIGYADPSDPYAPGSPLKGSSIDFSQSAVIDYQMDYTVCNSGSKTSVAVYDVRWNVTKLPPNAYLITVAARPQNMTAGRFTFALPVTMRLYVGNK